MKMSSKIIIANQYSKLITGFQRIETGTSMKQLLEIRKELLHKGCVTLLFLIGADP